METKDTGTGENVPQQIKASLSAKDARILELTRELEREREQTAYIKQVLLALTSSFEPSKLSVRKSPFSARRSFLNWLNVNSLVENWVANLLAGSTLPVLVLLATSIYAVVSRLNWYIPDKATNLLIPFWLTYWIMNGLNWLGGRTRHRDTWDWAYYIMVRSVGSICIASMGARGLESVGWLSGWYWLGVIVASYFGLAVARNWPLHEWDERLYDRIIIAINKRTGWKLSTNFPAT